MEGVLVGATCKGGRVIILLLTSMFF